MGGPGGEAHLIIPTHTTRWLRRTLMGVHRLAPPPHSVTVSSDTDRPDIREVLQHAADELGLAVTLVSRPHRGMERLSQVRNNAVRMLLERGVSRDARLVFLDGDCVPQPDMVARHLSLGRQGDLVIAFRIDLTPAQTEVFEEGALLQGRPPISPTPARLAEPDRRYRRYRRQQMLRRLGLAKRHKPKPLGGHHSVTLAMCRAVNGFDEEFHTWGTRTTISPGACTPRGGRRSLPCVTSSSITSTIPRGPAAVGNSTCTRRDSDK